ncbi:MAG: putative baseplate assembly protein [Actinomycetales bacterium]|nr:putative baseplate assembly protein [Actinomycetales bacterium]
MTSTQYHCGHERRRDLVRAAVDPGGEAFLNGIDYLEVSPTDQRDLTVRFLHPLPGQNGGVPASPALTRDRFVLDGGVRVTPIAVEEVVSTAADEIVLRTSVAGDFSTYTLRLVSSPVVPEPPSGFDPELAEVAFSFKVNCDTPGDCAAEQECDEGGLPAPHLSYLAKDYASFRRLILDRLSETMPDWQERSPADLGIVLVELLAYVGDHLSYFQDSVATEAYLDTARRRTSVRRHARLVDYPMHEGANARAWLVLQTEEDRGSPAQPAVPAGAAVGVATQPPPSDETAIVFETMHDLPLLILRRNAITFHTWGDDDCCLPAGATRATLLGSPAVLQLARGDVLLLEEVLGAASGLPEDVDRTHRHAVRLSEVPVGRVDPLTGTEVTDVRWHDDDALPFPLCLTAFDDGAGGTAWAAVARGNVVLSDHGRTVTSAVAGDDLVPSLVPPDGTYRPVLTSAGLTQAVPYDHAAATGRSARSATAAGPGQALPVIRLRGDGETWLARRDLLGSDRFAPHLVVETQDDGRAHLRFGDGVLGRSPSPGTAFTARFRLGGGASGNVGAEALFRLLDPLPGVAVRNPMPAEGGCAPEPVRRVKLDAPQAFRTQERAVTADDYAAAAQRHPDVSRAAATRRWTGSWHTMFLTVDRLGGRAVDPAFEAELRAFLERFRMAGYDLEIDAPRYVPLDLALTVCVRAHHDRAGVELAVREALGARVLPGGRTGFFHPDAFTFGQPVYLSQVLARAAEVPGVQGVLSVDTFGRYGEPPQGEIEQGFLPIHRLEIARLDNDPSDAERGRLALTVRGGT